MQCLLDCVVVCVTEFVTQRLRKSSLPPLQCLRLVFSLVLSRLGDSNSRSFRGFLLTVRLRNVFANMHICCAWTFAYRTWILLPFH